MGSEVPQEEDGMDFGAVAYGSAHPHIVEHGSLLPGRSRYLCFFIHRHLSFRLAETEALGEVVYGAATGEDQVTAAAAPGSGVKLSTGAIAGIAVGGAAGVALIAAVVVVLVRRR